MSILLRSLLFLSLSGMLFWAAPLCADGPPPLPRPSTASPLPLPANTNNGVLEGLSAFVSGTGNVERKIKVTNPPQPVQFLQMDYQEASSQQLSPPRPIRQASFTTFSLPPPSEETIHEELSPEAFYPLDEEPMDIPHEMLDKTLFSKKLAKEDWTVEEGEKTSKIGGWKNKLAKPELTPLFSVGGSLFIVIAAFFLLATLLRKVSPKGNRPLPKEAFECLGRYYLTQKHQLQVLRLGSRIVLVSVMPDGVSTLAEITDPDEAVSFLGLCRRLDHNSATEMFQKTISGMSEEELSRPHSRPVVTRRKTPPATSFDMYSDPDESLAAILARGRR